MYHEYTLDELRQYCRKNIESLETWARQLIHEKMVQKYGNDYIDVKLEDGNNLIKSKIIMHVKEKMTKEPQRYHRAVDTLFIDEIVYFLCHPVWYKELFKPALDYIYPQGRDEAREFLTRLISIRNPLSHSNPITMHDVERAICYSHDFVDGLKKYYKDRGEEQVWNVPRIVKIKDSLGNVFDNPQVEFALGNIFDIKHEFNCGDTYSVEVEVDSSFDKNDYNIYWDFKSNKGEKFFDKLKFTVTFDTTDVGYYKLISCKIVSKKSWHKYNNHDDRISLSFAVLPPIE